jgi:hypothetical protein
MFEYIPQIQLGCFTDQIATGPPQTEQCIAQRRGCAMHGQQLTLGRQYVSLQLHIRLLNLRQQGCPVINGIDLSLRSSRIS